MNTISQIINSLDVDCEKKDALNKQSDFPVAFNIEHDGFWTTRADGYHVGIKDEGCNKNSVIINSKSLPYVYKVAIRHYLLSYKKIKPELIDAQNLVPHVVVRKSRDDPKSNYDTIEKEQFIINEDSISVKKKFMIMELDKIKDLHMTIIFDKSGNISKNVDLLNVFKFVIRLLNVYPELIEKYSSLKYFGQEYVDYWYHSESNLYPFKSLDNPTKFEKPEPIKYKTTAAGSIIQ